MFCAGFLVGAADGGVYVSAPDVRHTGDKIRIVAGEYQKAEHHFTHSAWYPCPCGGHADYIKGQGRTDCPNGPGINKFRITGKYAQGASTQALNSNLIQNFSRRDVRIVNFECKSRHRFNHK
jgi:hypothetical protein